MCDIATGSGDCFGGAGGSTMNTPMNTLGVGDLVPAGKDTLGNDCYPWMDHRQNKRGRKSAVRSISTKRPAHQPFVTPGRNSGFDMSTRPLVVPHNTKRK